MTWTRVLVASALGLTLAACGSTVAVREQVAAGAMADEPGLTTSDNTGSTLGSQPTTGGTTTARTRTAVPPTPATLPSLPAAVAARPGGSVEVGILIVANGGSYLSAFGAAIDLGDPVAQARAAVREVNSHGGLGGRRVEPVLGYFDATSTQGYSVQLQAICARWTEDHHVVAGIVPAGINIAPRDLAACLGQRGVPLVNPSFFANDDEDFVQHPLLVNTAGFSTTRLSEPLVTSLEQQGFFRDDPRIGLLSYDLPQVRRTVERSLSPALARRGQRILDEVRITYPSSNADNAPAVAAIEQAVLRFQSDRINRVLFLAPGAAILFMQAAEKQLYRPRYGITSYEEPTLLLTATAVPAAQLANTEGIGWFPVLDVDDARDPGGNPAATRCRAAMAAGDAPITARSQALAAFSYCDGLWALQLAARGTSRLDGRSLISALDAAGPSYRSPLLLRTLLGPGRHDGAAGFRRLSYQTSCGCFAYGGATQPAP